MDPMFQLNQNMQTMMMAAGVASLNARRVAEEEARKAAEEKERLEKEATAKADWESRIHFIINIGEETINFDPHASSVNMSNDNGKLIFFDNETKKKLIIGYDSKSFAGEELDKIYAGTEYHLKYSHLTELKFLGVDYFKLINAWEAEKEYNEQLTLIDNKYKKKIVPVYSALEISFAENEMYKKIAEHNTDIYKKCNLHFLGWSIGTSIFGLIGLMILLFVHIAPGIGLLAVYGFASLVVLGSYWIMRDDINREKMQFEKSLEDELIQMKMATKLQTFDQENYKKEITRLNEKYVDRQYYLDWRGENAN